MVVNWSSISARAARVSVPKFIAMHKCSTFIAGWMKDSFRSISKLKKVEMQVSLNILRTSS